MSIKDAWREMASNRFGWTLFFGIAGLLVLLCLWAWQRFEAPLRLIFADPLSVGTVIGLLLLLYLLLIAARAGNERQYALFLQGRLQELVFLRQWKFFIAPVTVAGSLAAGYAMQGWTLPLTLVSWIGAVVGVYGFVRDVSGMWLRPVEHERYFFLPARTASDVQLMRDDSEIVVPSGYRALEPWHGRRICVPAERSDWRIESGCVTSAQVNAALQDDNSTLSQRPLERLHEPYTLPDALERYAETALIHLRARGSLLHNEAKIRLASEPGRLLHAPAGRPLVIQRTSYYASVCSNELAGLVVAPKDEPKSTQDLFSTVRRTHTGVLYDLDDSELSNHLGGGTLALTPGGKLLLSKQGRLAAVAAGLLAPAGAGSLDWSDQRGAQSFGALVKRGLERELREECSLQPQHIVRTIVLGMARDLARGGKPDFYAITLLDGRAAALQPRVHAGEIGLVDHHDSIALAAGSVQELRQQLEDWLSRQREHCSLALVMNLRLLIEASDETYAALLQHMGRG